MPTTGLWAVQRRTGTNEAVENALVAAQHGILSSTQESDDGMRYGIAEGGAEEDVDDEAV